MELHSQSWPKLDSFHWRMLIISWFYWASIKKWLQRKVTMWCSKTSPRITVTLETFMSFILLKWFILWAATQRSQVAYPLIVIFELLSLSLLWCVWYLMKTLQRSHWLLAFVNEQWVTGDCYLPVPPPRPLHLPRARMLSVACVMLRLALMIVPVDFELNSEPRCWLGDLLFTL